MKAHDLGWMVNAPPRSLYPRVRDPVTLYVALGAPGPVCTVQTHESLKIFMIINQRVMMQ